MVAGKKFVLISAPVVVARHKESDRPDARLIEERAESLPPRYNTESDLSLQVKAGNNTKNWALEGGERKP